MYSLEDYFGITGDQLATANMVSPEAPATSYPAAAAPTGQVGTVASFTDVRRSPVFWFAVFAVFALGMIHLEGHVSAALR